MVGLDEPRVSRSRISLDKTWELRCTWRRSESCLPMLWVSFLRSLTKAAVLFLPTTLKFVMDVVGSDTTLSVG